MNGRSLRPWQGSPKRRVLFRARGLVLIAAALIVTSIAASVQFSSDSTVPATIGAASQNRPVVRESTARTNEPISEDARRKVYRHSVIPGGAYSARELAAALHVDTVARNHYKTVRLDRVHVRTLAAPRQAYVSYRVGNRIYWTKHKVTIAAGESILSDGAVEIRARCGNCISSRPNTPTSDNEPPPPELDEGTDPPTWGVYDPREATPVLFPNLQNPPFAGEPSDPGPGGAGAPLLLVPFLWGGGGSSGGGSSSPPASGGLPPYTADKLPKLPPPLPPVADGNIGGDPGGSGDGDENYGPGDDNPGGQNDDGGDGDDENPQSEPPASVPEPSTILIAAAGAMTELARRLRGRRRL